MKRSIFKTIATLLLAGMTYSAYGSVEYLQKTYTWKYPVNRDASVKMDNYNCNLVIHTWDKGEAELRLTIDADIRSDEDAATLDEYLKKLVFSNSPSSVSFRSRFWENRTTVMNRTTMKLASGKSITITSFRMNAELWIPAGCRFELGSKYSRINMEDVAGPLILNLYNDNLYGGTVSGNTEIIDKYSTVEFKDMKDIKADLYNSKLDAGNTGDVNVISKYSRITLGSCSKLSIDSYNDKYEVPATGDVIFTAKYSDLATESSDNVTLDMYNGTVIMNETKDVKITSKYAQYQFSNSGRFTIISTYNDKLTAGKIISMDIISSKYSVFRIDYLAESLENLDSYNENLSVSETGNEFRGLSLNGRYITANVTLPKSLSYRFKANINYADLDINESSLKLAVKIINGSEVEYDAVKGTESEGMPVIELNGYQVTFKILER